MSWLQILFESNKENAEALGDLLTEAGALAITLKDCVDEPVYEPAVGETLLWSKTSVVGLFQADADTRDILSRLQHALNLPDPPACHIKRLEDQDWERAWIDSFEPMRFGRRLWICPSWCEPPVPDAVNIMLDPGLAFGTGTHPTTAMCLEWLDNNDISGLEIIDYGCGSGILAIAAAKLGAHPVWAVDLDQQALYATHENASKNNVEKYITAIGPEKLPALQADCLLANILAKPLMELAAYFANQVHTEASVILSGILDTQADAVRKCYQPWFDIESTRQQGDWVCLVARRRPK